MNVKIPVATIYYTLNNDFTLVSSLRVPRYGYLKKDKAKRYISRYRGIDIKDISIIKIEKEDDTIDFDLGLLNDE